MKNKKSFRVGLSLNKKYENNEGKDFKKWMKWILMFSA